MADEKKLYPFRFLPEDVEKDWGGERFALADRGYPDSMVGNGWFGGNTISELMQTYLERVVGDTSFEFYGTQFPVMVKFLDVKGRTSLHVNADDTSAAERYDAFGKTALWYVAEAGEDALLYMGFRRDVSASEFFTGCVDGSVEDILCKVRPEVGDSFLIPPGTVHAASGNMKIVEVAESSDLYFRLHSWGQGTSELHLEEAFDLIDFRQWDPLLRRHSDPSGTRSVLAATEQFTVNELRLSDPLRITRRESDSFLLYACVRGGAFLDIVEGDWEGERRYRLSEGEVLLVPSETTDFVIAPEKRDTLLLEAGLDPREEKDSYL